MVGVEYRPIKALSWQSEAGIKVGVGGMGMGARAVDGRSPTCRPSVSFSALHAITSGSSDTHLA